MASYTDSSLTIDLNALAKNYQLLAKKSRGAVCSAVVKANAYGLGVGPVAKKLAKEGAKVFFVAMFEEAVELRKYLKTQEICVFHGIRQGQEKECAAKKITPVINDAWQLTLWARHAKKEGKKLPAILHFDTGMNRLGFYWKDAQKVAKSIELGALNIKYIMSHLACASEADHELNNTQLKRFNEVRKAFPGKAYSLASSSGVYLGDCYHFDLVRPGKMLYGVNLVENPLKELQAVATVRAKILQVRELTKAEPVGYGATQVVPAGRRIATVPVGYADGYIRALSGKGEAYVEGKIVPLVGRVSMDLIVLDVTDIPAGKLSPATEVELLGKHITVDKVAKQAGTIGYEVLTRLGGRFKKEYIGEVK